MQMAWAEDPAACRLEDPYAAFANFRDRARDVCVVDGLVAEFVAAWDDVCAGHTFCVRSRTKACATYPPLPCARNGGAATDRLVATVRDQAAEIDSLRAELSRARATERGEGSDAIAPSTSEGEYDGVDNDDDFDMELDAEIGREANDV